MKIKKPEDEKYFKDIVHKDILEEISNEDEVQVENTAKPKRKKSSQKLIAKTIFYLIIMAILIVFSILLFSFVTDATSEKKPADKVVKTLTSEVDTQAWKMEEDRKGYIRKPPSKVKKTKDTHNLEILKVSNDTVKLKPVKSKSIPKQKTEHELAKEALRQQMLN